MIHLIDQLPLTMAYSYTNRNQPYFFSPKNGLKSRVVYPNFGRPALTTSF